MVTSDKDVMLDQTLWCKLCISPHARGAVSDIFADEKHLLVTPYEFRQVYNLYVRPMPANVIIELNYFAAAIKLARICVRLEILQTENSTAS